MHITSLIKSVQQMLQIITSAQLEEDSKEHESTQNLTDNRTDLALLTRRMKLDSQGFLKFLQSTHIHKGSVPDLIDKIFGKLVIEIKLHPRHLQSSASLTLGRVSM